MTADSLCKEMTDIVREASHFMTRDFTVKSKGTIANQVTSNDVAVEQFLKKKLSELLPGCGFIAEESESDATGCEYVFIIDPIDGTANYVRDLGASGISVGLFRDLQPYVSVVYNPTRDEMFSAIRGKGAYLNQQPIHVSDRDFAHSCFCTSLSCYRKERGENCAKILNAVFQETEDFRRFGAAVIELTALAAGRVELYYEPALAPWDHGASRLIIEEAGGILDNVYVGGITYDRQMAVIAANNRENLEKLRQMIQAVVPVDDCERAPQPKKEEQA